MGVVTAPVMVGFGFAAHGYAKLSRGPDQFAVILAAIGIPQPHLMAWVTSLLEFFGGLSMMIGAFTVPLTVPLALIMLTAMFSVSLSLRLLVDQARSDDAGRRKVWPHRL